MRFTSVRLISADVKQLAEFYERVLARPATWSTPEFAEVALPGFTLALGSTGTMALFGAGPAGDSQGPGGRSPILEFRVDDVDAEYERVRGFLTDVVQEPTTMPWGNRSLLFRDPDGHLVNLFTPVTPAARAKFGV